MQLNLNGLKDLNIRRTVLISLYSESLSLIGAGIGFIILWWSGLNIISGRFTLGSYLAFSAYSAQLFGPTQMLANLGFMLQPAKIALQRIRELLQADVEDETGRTRKIASLKGKIEIRDIYFEYETARTASFIENLFESLVCPGLSRTSIGRKYILSYRRSKYFNSASSRHIVSG